MKRAYALGTAIIFPVLLLGLIACFRPRDTAPETNRLLHGSIGSDKASDLAVLAEQSNLAFLGRVTRVDYRLGRSSEAGGALPHAIVWIREGNKPSSSGRASVCVSQLRRQLLQHRAGSVWRIAGVASLPG